MNNTAECKNTDRELWRGPDEGNGGYYADSIHVTEGGGFGIDVGGYVIVKPLREWHALAEEIERLRRDLDNVSNAAQQRLMMCIRAGKDIEHFRSVLGHIAEFDQISSLSIQDAIHAMVMARAALTSCQSDQAAPELPNGDGS